MFKSKYVGMMLLLLAISALLLISYYKDQGVKITPSFQTSSMENLYLTHKEDDKTTWELSAKEALFPIGENEIFLKSIGLKVNHTPEINLSSASGTYEIDKGDITFTASVEMNVKNTRFTTNTLKWNSASELLTTDDNVKFSGENFLIEGTGLSATLKQQKIRILKNVKATFYLS